jgi:hypothetical protein
MTSIKIEIEVPVDRLDKYIRHADIRHWGEMQAWRPRKLELDLVVEDDEVARDQRKIYVGVDEFRRGLVEMAAKLPHHFRDFMANKGDAYTGNVLVQLAAFGEIRYE